MVEQQSLAFENKMFAATHDQVRKILANFEVDSWIDDARLQKILRVVHGDVDRTMTRVLHYISVEASRKKNGNIRNKVWNLQRRHDANMLVLPEWKRLLEQERSRSTNKTDNWVVTVE